MKLREYIYQYPRGKRMMARKIIADALNVSESAIKTWEIGLRKPKPKYIEALLHLTNGEVNLNDIK